MIIVEGPDGSGKTTLLGRLAEHLERPIESRVVTKTAEAMVDLQQWVEHDLQGWPRAALYDRHRLISEPIYGPVIRGNMEPGFDRYDWLGNQLEIFSAHRPVIIWCMPPLDAVLKNLRGDPDNEVIAPHAKLIYWLYFMEMCKQRSNLNSWVWDYTKRDDAQFRLMRQMLKHKLNILETEGRWT